MSELTPEFKVRLRELAIKATPGPWGIARDGKTVVSNQSHPVAVISDEYHRQLYNGRTGEDAEFISTANPETIKALIAENERLGAESFDHQYYQDQINFHVAEKKQYIERALNAELELEALKVDIANYVGVNAQLVEENENLTARFDGVEGDPRIVSYADDMATCTLNYQGEEFFFDLSGSTTSGSEAGRE